MSSTELTFNMGYTQPNAPIVFEDVLDFTLIDPGTDYYMPNKKHTHGVFFRSATTGTFNVVTLYQYMANGGDAYLAQSGGPSTAEKEAIVAAAISASKNITIQLQAGQWTDVALAWIDATNGAATALNIGLY